MVLNPEPMHLPPSGYPPPTARRYALGWREHPIMGLCVYFIDTPDDQPGQAIVGVTLPVDVVKSLAMDLTLMLAKLPAGRSAPPHDRA